MERQKPLFANFRKYLQSILASAKNAYQILLIEPRAPVSYIESDGKYYMNLTDAKKSNNPITDPKVIKAIELRKARMQQMGKKDLKEEDLEKLLRNEREDL
ncbi:MAG: hypothetical protein RL023_23 [Candidatus Parcubacteria bacterium]|jgi:hypothetical protein